jgi:hypothetical protein
MRPDAITITIFYDNIEDPGYFARIRVWGDGWFEDEDIPLYATDYDQAVNEIRSYLGKAVLERVQQIENGGDYR